MDAKALAIMDGVMHKTALGRMVLGDSLVVLRDTLPEKSVNLIVTSPPFALVRKKDYGNAAEDEYLNWFRPFASAFKRVLKDNGSLVIDIGGSWIPGQPTRSLYHFKLLIMLCEEFGFHLAQDFFWLNPAKLPTPAEWVTVRRIRVKDAINCIWWLSPTPWPKASNRRVLQPYSDSMRVLLRNGYKAMKRPSGHEISENFAKDHGASIPPNLIALPNTESNGRYLRYCKALEIKPHPARYPATLPEFFVRMLTDPGDLVVDPFAGSCVTGEVCERIRRKWLCIEMDEEYLRGALGRFKGADKKADQDHMEEKKPPEPTAYRVFQPGFGWNGAAGPILSQDGGKTRILKKK
jgi:site-specific DNA-methyltransferase (cytosine-N4-specific)